MSEEKLCHDDKIVTKHSDKMGYQMGCQILWLKGKFGTISQGNFPPLGHSFYISAGTKLKIAML